MKTLYKYARSRNGFLFQSFLLKFSMRHELNDPFEVIPSNEAFAEFFLKNKHYNYGKTKEEIIKNLDSPSSTYIPSMHKDYAFDRYGIISFSETFDNLLMWSHYGDEHKGVVIGFKIDSPELSTKYCKTWDDKIGKPQKVNYRKFRNKEIEKPGSINDIFITKSDDWIYEKEHRMIIDIEDAEYILASKKTKNEIDHSIVLPWKEETIDGEEKYSLGSIHGKSSTFYKYNEIQYFISLSPESIDSVYLGARMDILEKQKICELITRNPKMNKCQIYQANISNCRYELDFTRN